MSKKLFEVLKTMLQHPTLISKVTRSNEIEEYYFMFKEVVFSLLQRDENTDFGKHSLYLYPKAKSITQTMNAFETGDSEGFPLIALHSNAGSSEAMHLIALHKILAEKDLGLDEIFNHLLS